jgi:hypothetical protein
MCTLYYSLLFNNTYYIGKQTHVQCIDIGKQTHIYIVIIISYNIMYISSKANMCIYIVKITQKRL